MVGGLVELLLLVRRFLGSRRALAKLGTPANAGFPSPLPITDTPTSALLYPVPREGLVDLTDCPRRWVEAFAWANCSGVTPERIRD